MIKLSQQPQNPTLPLAGRVAKLEAKPRSNAGEGGAKPRSLAKKLRAAPTLSELRMWRLLWSLRIDGYHFRKQVKLGTYHVDFACLHAGLVIEVDGITHHTAVAEKNDAVRDAYLRNRGFTVLRFSTQDVMRNENGVGDTILAALAGKPRNRRGSPPPSPTLPARGRVPSGEKGTIEPKAPNSTSPLAGEAGRGGATRSNPEDGNQ